MAAPWRSLSVALMSDVSGFVGGMGRAAAAARGFDSSLGGTAKSTTAFSRSIALAGTAGKVGFLGLAAGAAMAVNAASEFETRMSAVRAVSGATADELGVLRQQALDLGASTVFSATEVAGGMEELVKAGLTVEEVLNGASQSMVALASAGGIDLASAATISANALNTFSLAAEDLPGVADALAGAANSSAIGVDDLALSLQQGGAAAALAGLSLEDTITAIGLMGDAGIRGSDAGTSLKTMLLNLNPATEKQANEMERLGLLTEDGTSAFFDQQGEVKSLADIAGLLESQLGGLTRQQQLASLEIIFGSDAIRASAVLMGEGASGARDFASAMGELTAEDVAEMRLDNLSGDVEAFKGAIDTFLISSGTPMVEWLRDMVQLGTGAVEWMNAPPDGLVRWGQDMAGVVAASGRLITAGGDQGDMLDSLSDRYGGLGDAAEMVVPILKDVWSTGDNLRELAVELTRDLRPAAEGLAQLGGGAALIALRTTADAIERVTGFLADHHEIVLAAATAYGLWRASLIAGTVWTGITAGVGVVTGAYASYNAAMLFAVGNNRAQQIEMSRTRILMGLTATSAKNLAASTAFVSTVSFAGLGIAVTAIYTGMQNAEQQAKAWRSSVEEDIDTRSVASLVDAVGEAAETYKAARGEAEQLGLVGGNAGDRFKAGWRGGIELLTPLPNTVADTAYATAEAAEAAKDWAEQAIALKETYESVGETLDMSSGAVERWVRALDLDPDMGPERLAAAIDDGRQAAESGTPAVDGLTEAFTVLGDETSSATDQLDAWKTTMDEIAGVHISYEQALVGFTGSINDLTEAQVAGWYAGQEWSTNLQGTDAAALRTRETIAGLADEAIGLATSYYEAGGGIDGATVSLMSSRDAILEAGVAAGISEEDMRAYLVTLGLTPENITTVIEAQTNEGSLSAADRALEETARPRTTDVFALARAGGAEGHLAHLARDRTAAINVEFDVRGQGVVIGGGVTLANTGGLIPGVGPNVDSVPSMLTRGEYVFQQPVVKDFERSPLGVDWLHGVNAGRITPADIMAMGYGHLAPFNAGGSVGISGSWGSGSLGTWAMGRIGPEVLDKAQRAASAWMDENFAEAYSTAAPSGGGGGDAATARTWIIEALRILGLPMTWVGPAMRRANQESGYNPHAINLWDSNAKKGIPSKGLFQTIDPTFNAYKLPGFGDIWNGLHNSLAAFRYMLARYGSIFNLPSGGYNLGGLVGASLSEMTALPVHSYDAGGYLPTGFSLAHNGTMRPEPVGHNLTTPQATVAHHLTPDQRAAQVNVNLTVVNNVNVGNEKLGTYVEKRALSVGEDLLHEYTEVGTRLARAGARFRS